MRVAVIDMGTNTFHLIVVEVANNDFKIIYREKTAVKIGENGINRGMITDEAAERALTALHKFKVVLEQEDAQEVYATATSAIRNAANGEALVARIAQETGIQARIISGDDEAEYIYFGVKKALKIGHEPALIMDIGGGSIEFIIGTDSEILWKQSFEIGGLRMVERFQQHDPILFDEIAAVERYLDSHLQPLFRICQQYQPKVLIGSSGTFDTLSDIHCLENGIDRPENATEYPLTMQAFYDIYQELIHKNREQRLSIPGMIPLRVDMIVVASILIRLVLEKLRLSSIRVSAYALKEGVLLGTLHSLQRTPAS